jgi:hypothetical protein
MFSPSNNMRPKVFTSWWHKGSTSRVFPSLASTTACEKNNITNQNAEDQQNNNNATNKDPTLSILLREARDALIQTGERNSNLDLCARLDCAISAAEEDELNEKLVQSKTAEHQKRSSNFISSLTNFDDELTNFFLYNYSDHHGDHESLHNILKSVHCLIQKNNNNKNNSNDQISISPRSMNRHKSVATTHSLTHTVTSAKILELLVTWNFNIFELYDLVGPNTFVIVGDGIIQHLNNLITTLGFEQDKFLATLKCLGESYLDNPYHNQLHGADVAQALNWTLMFGGAANVFTPLDSGLDTQQQILSENDSDDMNRVPKITMLASVLAALAHDVGHPGVNNNYLIEVSDPLALTYNDHSPLEHMHAATFFRILQKDECTFIPTEFKEKRRAMRGVIVNMILSTDMMKHGSLVNLLKTRLTNGGATLTDDGRDIQMVLNICLHLVRKSLYFLLYLSI